MKRLLEGSEAIAESMIAAGCRFFTGYPMTPFTEVLEHMAVKLPDVGGSCINAESELEAIGMAWGAAATGTRAATGSTGQGYSLMQESVAELCMARIPMVLINMARGQSDYYQATRGGGHGDYRTPVLAPADIAEAVELMPLAFELSDQWRNPVLVYGDYYLAHTVQSVSVPDVPVNNDIDRSWALDGSTGGSGHAKLLSPLGEAKQQVEVGYDLSLHYHRVIDATLEMGASIEPLAETGGLDDAELVIVAFGTVGRFVKHAVGQLRAHGHRVGFVRPITLYPFPTAIIAAAAENCRLVACYETNAGQMIDDVRLAVVGRAPVVGAGGFSIDRSGFGIGPDIDVPVIRQRLLDVLTQIDDLTTSEAAR